MKFEGNHHWGEALDNGVIKSDFAVPEELRLALCQAVQPLEADKDWHPGSEDQVLDLVHPSLYPLVYGQTKILPRGTVDLEGLLRLNEHEVLPVPAEDDTVAVLSNVNVRLNLWSRKFQWLPAEFLCPPWTEYVE